MDAHLRAVGQALGQPPSAIQAQWTTSLGRLHSLEHAPKMAALLELLQQSGIAPLPPDAAVSASGEPCSPCRTSLLYTPNDIHCLLPAVNMHHAAAHADGRPSDLLHVLWRYGTEQSPDQRTSGVAGKEVEEDPDVNDSAAGHRVLIFAQLKALLDLVQTDIMRPFGISYLRLDGR